MKNGSKYSNDIEPSPVFIDPSDSLDDNILYFGEKAAIKAKVHPQDYEQHYFDYIDWKTTNSEILFLSGRANNKYVADVVDVSVGTVNVWAEIDDVSSDKLVITVKQPTAKITKLPTNGIAGENTYILKDGTTHQLGIDLNPKDVEGTTYIWESSNENVATIDANGKITTITEGETVISYTAKIGGTHSATDVFTLRVVSVKSIEVKNTTADDTIRVGDVCNLTATVKPINNFNQSVYWLSGDRKIATVNGSGKVTCKNIGTVTIYAVSIFDSSIKGEIKINILPKVTGITITNIPLDSTLYVGENTSLGVHITQRSAIPVMWSSNNPEVAEVNPNTGLVTAKKAGTAIITARIDSSLADTFELKVKNESVTIFMDEYGYPKVTFNSQDKEWYCVNYDLINGDNTEYLYSIMNDRAERNLFKNPAEKDFSYKTYTDEEIQLLYSIDPYGVAHYVSHYAHQYDTSKPLNEILEYKDRIFKVLFGREPDYFARAINREWYKTTNKEDLSKVLSEAELIFGMHTVYDMKFWIDFCGNICSIISTIIGNPLLNIDLSNLKKSEIIGKYVLNGLKWFFLSANIGYAVIKNDYINFTLETGVGELLDNTAFGFFYNSFSIVGGVLSILKTICDKPSYNKELIYSYSSNIYYDIIMYNEKGEQYYLNEIKDAIELL